MTSFTKGAEAMREMAAKACDNMAEERGAAWGGDARMLGRAIRALPLPSQPEDDAQAELWSKVRILAEGSDWKRGSETLAEWAWRTIRAKQPEDSSARGVVVPREPTYEMLSAWQERYFEGGWLPKDGIEHSLMIECYKAMLAAAPQQNAAPVSEQQRWIPCSEKLPNPSELVIAWTDEFEALLADRSTSNPDHGWSCMGVVTHWMPMPDKPSER